MPSKIYHDIELTVTPTAGTGSVNADIATRGSGVLFYIHPLNETTTWDLKIIDSKSRVVRYLESETGTYREDSTDLPMLGVYTFRIENASADELFEIYVRVEQVHG